MKLCRCNGKENGNYYSISCYTILYDSIVYATEVGVDL